MDEQLLQKALELLKSCTQFPPPYLVALNADSLCEGGRVPCDLDGVTRHGRCPSEHRCLHAGPCDDQRLRGLAVEVVGSCQCLHLEGVLPAPFTSRVGVGELVRTQRGFHNAVHINLVARDVSITVSLWFLPFNCDIAEIAGTENYRQISNNQWQIRISHSHQGKNAQDALCNFSVKFYLKLENFHSRKCL